MEITPYCETLAAPLAIAYQEAFGEVPHCPPVDQATIALALRPTVATGTAAPAVVTEHGRTPLGEEAAYVALQGAQARGWVHVAIAHPVREGEAPWGVVRSLWYARGERPAGQALLDAGEQHLRRAGVERIVACHYEHRYPFCQLPHMHLSARLDHVAALLGVNGYDAFESELGLAWPHFATQLPLLPAPPVEVRWVEEWEEQRGFRPRLVLKAMQEERRVGICVCAAGDEGHASPQERDWTYTRWLWVADELRGQGLGRHLVWRALAIMRAQGYRHAAICCLGHNHRALLLYGNLGYRTVDWSWAYRKGF